MSDTLQQISVPLAGPDRFWRFFEERLELRKVLGGARTHDGAADQHGPNEALVIINIKKNSFKDRGRMKIEMR